MRTAGSRSQVQHESGGGQEKLAHCSTTDRGLGGFTPTAAAAPLSRPGSSPQDRSRDWSPSNRSFRRQARVTQEAAQGRASPRMTGRLGREKREEVNFFLDRIPSEAPWSPAEENLSHLPHRNLREKHNAMRRNGESLKGRRDQTPLPLDPRPLSSSSKVPATQVGPRRRPQPHPGPDPEEKQQQT